MLPGAASPVSPEASVNKHTEPTLPTSPLPKLQRWLESRSSGVGPTLHLPLSTACWLPPTTGADTFRAALRLALLSFRTPGPWYQPGSTSWNRHDVHMHTDSLAFLFLIA